MLTTKNTREATFLFRCAVGKPQDLNASTVDKFISDINRSFANALIEICDNLLNLSESNQSIYIDEILYELSDLAGITLMSNEELEQEALKNNGPPLTIEINKEAEESLPLGYILDRRVWRVRTLLSSHSIKVVDDEAFALFDEYDWFAYQYDIAARALNSFWWQFRPHVLRRGIKLPDELHMWGRDLKSEDDSSIDTPRSSEPVELRAPLQWRGTGVELAALLVELDSKGYILLPSQNNFDRTPWERICRSILGLFTITTQRTSAKGEPWYNFSRNFVSRAENEKTGELEYHKLHEARRKFKHILPRTPGVNDPK